MSAMPKAWRVPLWAAVLTLLVVAALAAAVFAWQGRRMAELAATAAGLESEKRQLSARAEHLARENDSLRQTLGMPPRAETERPAQAPKPQPSSAVEHVRLLVQMQDKLAAANSSLADLQARVDQLEDFIAKAAEENKRLAASEEEFRDRFASASRVLEAVQAELKTRTDRLVQLETTNNLLHQENREISQRNARLGQWLRELEEIDRRREAHLGNILRRYRDITDQFRTLVVRAESPGEARAADSAELSRIQNAISLTEEDLRQVSGLNAQASRLQQRIAGR